MEETAEITVPRGVLREEIRDRRRTIPEMKRTACWLQSSGLLMALSVVRRLLILLVFWMPDALEVRYLTLG